MWIKSPLFFSLLVLTLGLGFRAAATPTVVNDQFYVPQNSPQIDLATLDNDSDPTYGFASMTISSVGTAAHGTVTNQNTFLYYTPTVGYSGPDSFTYTVSDGHGTATGTVIITVMSTPAAPAMELLSAPMVTPTNAWTHYGSSTTHTSDPIWATARPEIAALAKSLGAGQAGVSPIQYSQNVYDYIRNNISTEFRFGLGKGGRGALIDQSGTPFDQADLMVQLLAQDGISATFQTGNITLTPAQFGLWAGLVSSLNQSAQSFTVSAQAACQFLADGGIAAVINGITDNGTQNYCNVQVSGSLTSVQMAHVWVAANGYLYDPSFKQLYLKAGLNSTSSLAAAMGCGTGSSPTCGSTLQTDLLTGATTGTLGSTGAPTVTGLNEASVLSALTSYATNLEATIKSTNSIGTLQDIVGGATPNPAYTQVASASLPYSAGTPTSWSNIPDQFRTTVTYQFCGQTVSTYGDVLAGRRIRQWPTLLTYSGTQSTSGTSTYVEDSDILDCTWSTGAPSASSYITLTVQPPYAASGSYGLTTITSNVQSNGNGVYVPLDIFVQLGEASESTVTYFTDLANADPTPFHAGGTGASACNVTGGMVQTCHGDVSLNGFQLLSDQSRAASLVARVAGAALRHHARLGYFTALVGNASDGDVESIAGTASSESAAGDSATANMAFELAAHASSMLEGALGGDWEPMSGSTNFVLDNRAGGKFVDVSPSNMAAVIPNLTNYGSRTDNLQALANAGYESIIPVSGLAGCLLTTLCGAFNTPDYEVQNGSVGLLLIETLKGATNVGGVDPAAQVLASVKSATQIKNALSQGAAVDRASGEVNLTPPPDIVAGSGDFPQSLPFQRYYESSNAVVEHRDFTVLSWGNIPAWSYSGPDQYDQARLGGGWQHNYQINANITTDVPAALGQDRALDASAFIAGAYVNSLLLKSPTFDSRLTALFVDYWMAKQLYNNAVFVRIGPKTTEFIKLPDNLFVPPPGSSANLVQSGSPNLIYYPGNAQCPPPPYPLYDYNPISLNLTNPDGDVIHFDEANPYIINCTSDITIGYPTFKADSWAFPNGNTVAFSYTAHTQTSGGGSASTTYDVLNKVSNSFGRSLNFATTWVGAGYTDYQGNGETVNVGWMINSVTDENGRVVSYALSNCPTYYPNYGTSGTSAGQAALACNTLSVTEPDASVWAYGYAPGTDSPDPSVITRAPYHLRRWFPPSSPSMAYEVVTYDGLYRAATLTDPLGHATSYYASALFPFENWKRAQAIDPLGYISTNIYDQWSSLLQSTDPLGRVSTFAYDTARRKVLSVSPLWDCTLTVYDIRSNVVSSTSYPSVMSGSTPTGTCAVTGLAAALPPNPNPPSGVITTIPSGGITTSATFNEAATVFPCVHPITCNKPATETDALSNVTNYSWDSTTGNLTQVLKPADMSGVRPETDLVYTPLTGSSACSNGVTAGGMALVCQKTDKISSTSSLVTAYAYNGSTNFYTLATATLDPGSSPHLNLRTCFKFDVYGNLISSSDPRATSCP